MNIQEMLKNVDPKTLQSAMENMSKFMNPSQKEQMAGMMQAAENGNLNDVLKNLNMKDIQNELSKNPDLMKQVAQNPDISQKLNEIFSN